MKYYLLTLIRVPVNLFPRVFYWKFHFYFMLFYFFSIKSWRNQLWAVAKFCNITVIFSPTSSEHHEFVNVGVNWGINASKNRIVCLRRAPSFFSSPPRLDVRCFPSHTETYEPVSELRHSTPHLSHKRTHTPRCCGSETQPECDRTLLRYASRKFGEGRAPPINSQNAPLHLRFLLTPRNESRLCSSSSGSHVKKLNQIILTRGFSPKYGCYPILSSFGTGEQAHGAGRYNQGCTPNQQQTWGITSFTCMRKSALFMKKLLPLPTALSPVIKLSWRWPLQAVAAATIWLQFVYFIILQSRWLQAARCFLPFVLLQPYDMVASFRGSGAVCCMSKYDIITLSSIYSFSLMLIKGPGYMSANTCSNGCEPFQFIILTLLRNGRAL